MSTSKVAIVHTHRAGETGSRRNLERFRRNELIRPLQPTRRLCGAWISGVHYEGDRF